MTRLRRFVVALLPLLILLSSILVVNVVSVQPGEVTLGPTDDTYVMNTIPANFGSENNLLVGFHSTRLEPPPFRVYFTYLKFNLSSLPKEAIGVAAVLKLYTTLIPIYETHNVTAHFGLDNSWQEDTLTIKNCVLPNQTVLDVELVANKDQMYTWIVTDAVIEANTRNQTELTIVLKPSFETDHEISPFVEFNSKEYGEKTPELTISWTDIPEFPSLHILPIFVIATLLAALVHKRKKSKV